MAVSCSWVTLAAAATATGLSQVVVRAFANQGGSTYLSICSDGSVWINQTLVTQLTP